MQICFCFQDFWGKIKKADQAVDDGAKVQVASKISALDTLTMDDFNFLNQLKA